MLKKVAFVVFALLLSGCTMTQPEPYQADREPEDRTEYNGIEGIVQQQKDQGYLMSKALRDKCDNARVDLAVAESQGQVDEIATQKDIIANTCR